MPNQVLDGAARCNPKMRRIRATRDFPGNTEPQRILASCDAGNLAQIDPGYSTPNRGLCREWTDENPSVVLKIMGLIRQRDWRFSFRWLEKKTKNKREERSDQGKWTFDSNPLRRATDAESLRLFVD